MTEPKEAQADHVLIKRGLYYRPDRAGYTALKCEAGLYSASYADGLESVTAIPFADADEFAPAAWEETKVNYYKKQAATLAAENAALREKLAEREALLRDTINAAANIAYVTCAKERHVTLGDKVRDEIQALTLTGGDNAQG